ncbi:MAG: hypothetical protein COU65_04375 [Candidatus Pacebacteria bacterium CG10_big_fil_rev_8_21_14_0_10_42_12]|nr:MAG: hypothetical protein COU65_04375 [Candidatus Pacebacteria bacterium CG10_big_fil_rev_8_21_14_0_10_42_12]
MRFIKIKKYDYEPEWFVGFTFSNGTASAYHEMYLNVDELPRLANKLINFPERDKKIGFEFGNEDPKDNYENFIKILIYVYNSSGHTAINIMLSNNKEKHLAEKSHFSILCTPADINYFGNQLLAWCSNPDDELYIEFKSDILK